MNTGRRRRTPHLVLLTHPIEHRHLAPARPRGSRAKARTEPYIWRTQTYERYEEEFVELREKQRNALHTNRRVVGPTFIEKC